MRDENVLTADEVLTSPYYFYSNHIEQESRILLRMPKSASRFSQTSQFIFPPYSRVV